MKHAYLAALAAVLVFMTTPVMGQFTGDPLAGATRFEKDGDILLVKTSDGSVVWAWFRSGDDGSSQIEVKGFAPSAPVWAKLDGRHAVAVLDSYFEYKSDSSSASFALALPLKLWDDESFQSPEVGGKKMPPMAEASKLFGELTVAVEEAKRSGDCDAVLALLDKLDQLRQRGADYVRQDNFTLADSPSGWTESSGWTTFVGKRPESAPVLADNDSSSRIHGPSLAGPNDAASAFTWERSLSQVGQASRLFEFLLAGSTTLALPPQVMEPYSEGHRKVTLVGQPKLPFTGKLRLSLPFAVNAKGITTTKFSAESFVNIKVSSTLTVSAKKRPVARSVEIDNGSGRVKTVKVKTAANVALKWGDWRYAIPHTVFTKFSRSSLWTD